MLKCRMAKAFLQMDAFSPRVRSDDGQDAQRLMETFFLANTMTPTGWIAKRTRMLLTIQG